VEFGEFRQVRRIICVFPAPTELSPSLQFLRLDSPPPPPPDFEKSSPPPLTTGTTSPKLVSLDDFASLNLTPDELAALEAEIRGGETFDSALPPSSSRPQQTYSSTTHHAVQSLRITKSVVDANGEKVNVVRPLPDRPLASEVVKDDFEGIDDVPEDELEALARELEEEERAAAGDRAVEEEAPLPTPPVPGAATKSEVGDKQETIPAEQRSNKAEVEKLKKGLNARKEEGEVVGEVPALGTPAMVKRVAAAIRDGTL
jgi:hypothetical protein